MRIGKSIGIAAAVIAAIGFTSWARNNPSQPGEKAISPATPASDVARGKYLVNAFGCSDCHTPFKMGPQGPQPDMTRYLSGHPQDVKLPAPPAPSGPWIWSGNATNTAYAGPWGISYAFNLTSDQTTGLGIWTEEMFIKAMRKGKHFGEARQILPPMPWQAIGQLNDEDLKAVFAYLKTVPPVKNLVPDAQPAPMK
jgi:mono/diheme cytochrome c family protein